jgi:lysophospholipase L1-like esterase
MSGFIEKHFMEPQRRMKALQFEELTLHGGEIVFLGDSITEGGSWHEWFPGQPIVNRGIGGDTTDGVLRRLHSAIRNPSKVFILIGTNDFAFRRPEGDTLANARLIVQRIREAAPDAELVIQSVMPRKRKYRDRIERLNAEYRALALVFDATYLDLWPLLGDEADELRAEFTLDGLHLNGAGYRVWVEALAPYVRSPERFAPQQADTELR